MSILGLMLVAVTNLDSADRTFPCTPLSWRCQRNITVQRASSSSPRRCACVPARGVLQPAVAGSLLFSVPPVHDGASSPVPRGYPRIHEEQHR